MVLVSLWSRWCSMVLECIRPICIRKLAWCYSCVRVLYYPAPQSGNPFLSIERIEIRRHKLPTAPCQHRCPCASDILSAASEHPSQRRGRHQHGVDSHESHVLANVFSFFHFCVWQNGHVWHQRWKQVAVDQRLYDVLHCFTIFTLRFKSQL